MHIICQFRRLKIIPFSRPSMPLSPPRGFAPCWALFVQKKTQNKTQKQNTTPKQQHYAGKYKFYKIPLIKKVVWLFFNPSSSERSLSWCRTLEQGFIETNSPSHPQMMYASFEYKPMNPSIIVAPSGYFDNSCDSFKLFIQTEKNKLEHGYF